MHFLQLPTDVFIVIFSHLSGRDLTVCKQICKTLRALFKSSTELSYRSALARAGLVDGAVGYPRDQRLKFLRQLEGNWYPQELRPRRQLKTQLSVPCTEVETTTGFVVHGIPLRNSGNIEGLQVYRLPSYLPDLKAKSWRYSLTEPSIKRFKLDPAQDLLVLLEFPEPSNHGPMLRVHLRTLSSNKPHPSARVLSLEVIELEFERYILPMPDTGRTLIIRICMDMIAILVGTMGVFTDDGLSTQEVVLVWQWTSGQHLATLVSSHKRFEDFTFVQRDQLLLTHSNLPLYPTLTLVRLQCGAPYSTSFDPTILVQSMTDGDLIFLLPGPPCARECVSITSIKFVGDFASHAHQPHNGEGARPPLFNPDPDPEASLIGLSISVTSSGPTPTTHHTLLVRASVFASCTWSAHPIPFEKWSTLGVHWLLGSPGFLHGQRYARTTTKDQQRTYVEIYDFNPYHVPSPKSSGWQTLLKSSKQPSSSVYIKPKMSSLGIKTQRGCTSHKYYFDCEKLTSSLKFRKQTMQAGFSEQETNCALDCERVIVLDVERGGHIFGFTSYSV